MNRSGSIFGLSASPTRGLPPFIESVHARSFAEPKPRFEFKYRVDEATADIVRDYVRSFLEVDKYARGRADAAYPVNSCYLDSPDLRTFWHTVNGSRDRYKLRVRTYDDRPDSPVFFEIKRRVHGRIIKHRGAVRRGAVTELVAGRPPQPEDMANPGHDHLLAVERFVQLLQEIEARPTAFVRYQREAWVGPGEPADRVTMDREVAVWPTSTVRLEAEAGVEPARPFGEVVILEMKFSDQPPAWLRDLEQLAGLRRESTAKYCDGILTRGVEQFAVTEAAVADPAVLDRVEARRRRNEGVPLPLPAWA